MQFYENDVATLVHVPRSAFTMLEGRMMVVLAHDRSDTDRGKYVVTPLLPLSAAEHQVLGHPADAGAVLMEVYGGQLEAIPSQAVYIDVSVPDAGGGL